MIESGSVELSVVYDNTKEVIDDQLPIVEGTPPVKAFNCSSKSCRAVIVDSVDGRVPVS